MGNRTSRREDAESIGMELPPYWLASLALPADKDEILSDLNVWVVNTHGGQGGDGADTIARRADVLTPGEREFIEMAYSSLPCVRSHRYYQLSERSRRQGVQALIGPEKGLRAEDLVPPLCSAWYHACKILFDIGMPGWNIDWVNESPYGEEFELHVGSEPDPVIESYLACRERSAEERKTHEHGYYGQNPFFQWQGDFYSCSSRYERLPTDYARCLMEAQDNLVAGLEALGNSAEAVQQVEQLIDGLGESLDRWMGTDETAADHIFAHPPVPMYGGGMVDSRLHRHAGAFMRAMLEHASGIAARVQRNPE